ncbi:MAG: serine hydrolase [Candidatus Accumulibacter sp.]|jgi:D-alanyl-D-alanine endopeptidase (penicillin-binding protein 7)|nr:serine hydrolase [Accumulibacter sp.]
MLVKLKSTLAFFAVLGMVLGLMPHNADAAPKGKTVAVSRAGQPAVAGKKKPGASSRAGAARTKPAPLVKSGAAFVVEQGGGALFQKNAGAVVPIASISKLMTAMVVLDDIPDLRADIAISEDDIDYLRGSRSRLHVGATMTRETALLLALMSSENRAAHALARYYRGGLPAFVAAMNAKARSLGMFDTHFEDPTGLSSNNVSTARDLAKMAAAAYRYPIIREFSTTPEATVEISGQPLEFHNTNPLVRNAGWQVGLSKTGYINEAGKCLLMQARVADRQIVIILLDAVGKLTRVGDANRIKRWMEATLATQAASGERARRTTSSFDAPAAGPAHARRAEAAGQPRNSSNAIFPKEPSIS